MSDLIVFILGVSFACVVMFLYSKTKMKAVLREHADNSFLFDYVDMPVIIINDKCDLIYSNKNFQSLNKSKIINLYHIIFEKDIKKFDTIIDSLYYKKNESFSNLRLKLIESKIVDFNVKIKLLKKDDKKEKSLILCVFEDENYVREIEKRFQDLTEMLPVGVFETDERGIVKFANPACFEMFKYDKAIVENGFFYKEIVIDDYKDLITKRYNEMKSGSSPFIEEYIVIRADGTVFPVLIKSSAKQDRNGNFLGLRGIIIDITDRKEIKKELKESEQRYRLLAENSVEVIWTMDFNGNYTYISPSVNDLQGFTVEEAVNLSVDKHMTADSALLVKSKIENGIKRIYKGENVKEVFELELKKKDGSTIWAETTAKILFDDVKKVPYAIQGSTRDITERKLMEKEIEKAHLQLEERVKQRTAELIAINKKLNEEIIEKVRIENQLKLSVKEKDLLLMEVHHRVKNNLQIISSLLSLQGKQADSQESKKIFINSKNRIKSMALIHEKLYAANDFLKINMSDYIESLINQIQFSFNEGLSKVKFSKVVEVEEFEIFYAIPCGLIINELLSNIAGYCCEISTEAIINVSITKDVDNFVILSVADESEAFPENYFEKEENMLAFELVKTLSSQIDGELFFENKDRISFIIKFAIK